MQTITLKCNWLSRSPQTNPKMQNEPPEFSCLNLKDNNKNLKCNQPSKLGCESNSINTSVAQIEKTSHIIVSHNGKQNPKTAMSLVIGTRLKS